MSTQHSDSQGLVFVSTESNQAMYLNGELVQQAPVLSIEFVLEELGIGFSSHYLSNPCNPVVRRGIFPVQLSRVILEEDSYTFQGASQEVSNG
jgi:hypothetical protein